MGDIKLGRNSRVKLNGVTVARMKSFSLSENNETLDVTSFGDTHLKYERGMQSWTASISGHMDVDDASQSTLRTAARAGSKLTDLELYVDSTAYYSCDTDTDAEACCIISSFSRNAEHNGIVSFDMEVTGSGPLKETGVD
jgi:predicted secreted protein